MKDCLTAYRKSRIANRVSRIAYRLSLIALAFAICGWPFAIGDCHAGQTLPARRMAGECEPNIYVPYADLAELIEPSHRAVLMDRAQFERLLAAAEANAQAADTLQLGQVKNAQYAAEVSGEQPRHSDGGVNRLAPQSYCGVTLTGELEVVSMSDGPVAVPLGFAQIGLTDVVLDGSPAPLGYDQQGRLTLTVTGKGSHKLGICGTAKLKELSSGGMQFSVSLPQAVAATMKLAAAGDLEMHATAPISQSTYDRQADRTTAELTLGGQDKLTVVLLGNGRQADERVILLGESASTVNLTPSHQILSCLYTVQILRRSVRELEFEIPSEWTVTEITCPNLVQWSVSPAEQPGGTQTVKVRLRAGRVGSVPLHITAAAPTSKIRNSFRWRSPRLTLVDAAYQRGYMVVNTDEALRVRGEKLADARREDMPTTASVPGLVSGPGGRLYFHWGDNWLVELELETAAPKRSIKERQKIVVSAEEVIVSGEFEVTAVERELFEMSFLLGGYEQQLTPAERGPWQIASVQVDQKQTGFEYRVEQHGDKRRLIVELPQPVQPEKAVNVRVELRHVPPDWRWPSEASARTVFVPLIESEAESVSGQVSISATGDLEAQPRKVPDGLEIVPVGRFALLGIARDVQYAYSYNAATKGQIEVEVSRRRPRISGEAVGLIAVSPRQLTGDWRITYVVSRASAERLYVLADKSLGQNISITSPTVAISSKSVVPSAESTAENAEHAEAKSKLKISAVSAHSAVKSAENYNLWLLNLDHRVSGAVILDIHYERPLTGDSLQVPLVRPICQGQINEHLAVQASEELALRIEATGGKEVDAIDLPPLPGRASRILAAFRLDSASTPTGAQAAVKLQTTVHSNYEILSVLATSAELITYLDVQGGQRTQADFHLANAGKQFLTMRLPDGAELWSLRVNDAQAKPQRSAAGDYQVAMGQLGRQVDVRIVYSYQPRLTAENAETAEQKIETKNSAISADSAVKMELRQIELGGVELPAVAISSVRWTVIPPPGYRITTQHTKMQTHQIPPPKPAYLTAYNFLAKNMFTGSLLFMERLSRQGRARKGVALSRVRSPAEADELRQMVQEGVPVEGPMPAQGQGLPPQKRVPAQRPPRSAVQDAWQAGPAPPRGGAGRPVQTAEPQQKYAGVRLVEQGRVTLPVDLVPTAGAGPSVTFTGLGAAKLIVGLSNQSRQENWWAVGFALAIIVGVTAIKKKVKVQIGLVVAVLSITSLLAIWWPATTHLANGGFMAGICLVPLYLMIRLCRSQFSIFNFRFSTANRGGAALLLIWLLCIAWSSGPATAFAGAPTRQSQSAGSLTPQDALRRPDEPAMPVIIPYDGDPTAIKDSEKILVPYSRFVQLWNQAHPEDPIDGPKPGTDISLAAVRYRLTVEAEQARLVLTADVTTYGKDPASREPKGWVVLGLPVSGLAVTSATLAGEPRHSDGGGPCHSDGRVNPPTTSGGAPQFYCGVLQSGPKGMVLMLPAGVRGRLEIQAVTTPEYLGRRGSVTFSLPPLPAAVMDVILPDQDLELEIDDIEGTLTRHTVNGKVQWTFGLGLTRSLTMRWLPNLGGGVADRTLSANCVHDVYAFHWALVGVTKIAYSFSGGERDRFGVLLPADCVLTELKGTNIRDYREIGQVSIENMNFKVVEARLYRPATKQYELTVRWLGALPAVQKSTLLPLVRAGDVGRESGVVTLYAAGGMAVKTTRVSGGRRMDLDTKPALSEGAAADAGAGQLSSDRAEAVASYYWPYRPFELYVELARLMAIPEVHLDQLVRVAADRAELLVQANLKVERGRMFGARFALPAGYELLSVVGAAVESFYQASSQPRHSDGGVKRLAPQSYCGVCFHRGQQETKIALVLLCRKVRLDEFDVPTITYIDSVGGPPPKQRGRVAVQLAASFEAKTLVSPDQIGVKPISPATLNDWLDGRQIDSVRYAYSYDMPNPLLRLNIVRLPTQIRLETFAGLVVRAAAAVYTYRLRYDIAGSPVDQLSFKMPSEYAPLAMVESPAMRNVTQSDAGGGQTRWTVTLVDEVTGVVDVTVNFALPIEAATSSLIIPVLSTGRLTADANVPAGYRAIVAVQNMSRHDISVKDKVNLSELATSEQQTLMPGEMRESLQYVLQSFEQDWSLHLDLKPAKTSARIQAVVDLMALTTVIDRAGHCRYEARLAIQNRSEQFLRVKLPPGLRLWSAHVAGQPVKPVVEKATEGGQVLIPLVKTSPGGLPYDVLLYFADDGVRPLIAPFNGITKLSPPAISVLGIPVTRTTWSLHLPAGYRYLRPGGNMSAVVGPVEVLSLGIQARLEQLERLEKAYRDVAGTASQKELAAKRNWEAFNRDLAGDISQAEADLDAYRAKVGEADFQRLKSTLGEQRSRKDSLIVDNSAFIQRQQEQARNDMNFFLNTSASNAGVGEIVRNDALFEMPNFVDESARQQITRLQQELQAAEQQVQVREQEMLAADTEKDRAKEAGGKAAKDLIAEYADKPAEMAKMLGELSRESAAQIDQQQAQLRGQLRELVDNRLRRHFQAGQDLKQEAKKPESQALAGAVPYRFEARGGYGGYGMGGMGRQPSIQTQPAQLGPGTESTWQRRQLEPVASAVPSTAAASAPAAREPAVEAYVARGVYSLPVTLPEGEVRLDFARPGGQVEISLWAVPTGMLKNLYRTLMVSAAVLVALGAVKIWPRSAGPRPARPRPLSVKRIVIYACVLVPLVLILGLLGLLAGLLVILLAERLWRPQIASYKR